MASRKQASRLWLEKILYTGIAARLRSKFNFNNMVTFQNLVTNVATESLKVHNIIVILLQTFLSL